MLIHATLRHVAQMQSAKEEEMQGVVNVLKNTLETPMLVVGQNVLFTLTVPQTKHARETSALTRVPEHVVAMQGVEL